MKKSILLGIAAAALILTTDLESAGAYFTTYAEAGGGMRIDLGAETELQERFSVWTKHISIVSKEDSEPVFVRVKAFCGSAYQLVYSDASSKWSLGEDGYYYYQDILYGKETTMFAGIIQNRVSQWRGIVIRLWHTTIRFGIALTWQHIKSARFVIRV